MEQMHGLLLPVESQAFMPGGEARVHLSNSKALATA